MAKKTTPTMELPPLSVNDAAAAAKVTPGRIRQLCSESLTGQGPFSARRAGNQWEIDPVSFGVWRLNRRPGRKPGMRIRGASDSRARTATISVGDFRPMPTEVQPTRGEG